MDKTIQKTVIFGVDNNNVLHKLVEAPGSVSLSNLVVNYVFTKYAGLGADNKDAKAWELVYKALDKEENIVDEVASSLFSLQCFIDVQNLEDVKNIMNNFIAAIKTSLYSKDKIFQLKAQWNTLLIYLDSFKEEIEKTYKWLYITGSSADGIFMGYLMKNNNNELVFSPKAIKTLANKDFAPFLLKINGGKEVIEELKL